jgi:hypothetical protein
MIAALDSNTDEIKKYCLDQSGRRVSYHRCHTVVKMIYPQIPLTKLRNICRHDSNNSHHLAYMSQCNKRHRSLVGTLTPRYSLL